MGREHESFNLTDKPIRICNTAADRVPFLTNTGDTEILVDTEPWPMGSHALTLRPGVTIPFISPMPASDSVPVFVKAASGSGAVEYWFAR